MNHEKIAQTALGFRAAAAQLNQRVAQLDTLKLGQSSEQPQFVENIGCLMGTAILYAFALELIIKAVLEKKGLLSGKHHSLKVLFDLLPATDKSECSNRFRQEQTKRFPSASASSLPDLAAVINKHTDDFVRWRYQHEYLPSFVSVYELDVAFDIFASHLSAQT